MKIHDAFTEYFTNLKINEGKSKRTVSSYTNDLKQYIHFLEEHSITNTKKIKAELIEERLNLLSRLETRDKLRMAEKQLSQNIYQRGVDDKGFGRIRSKGDTALFG